MSERIIICAVAGRSQANRIVGHLINGGFGEDSVSILFADKREINAGPAKNHSGVSMMAKAGVGALLGGAFVWLGGTGVLSVPDLGSLIIAGAPFATVMGWLNRGGVTHALQVMGVSRDEACDYEARVREGNILISIDVGDDREAIAANRIIRAIGVQNITDTAVAEHPAERRHNIGGMTLECAAGC